MLILVPIVYSENDERRAFLYKVSARTRSSIEGIEINENSELAKYQELVKTLVDPDSHIEVQVLPIDNTVRRIEEISDNMVSMTLGIFLAIENQINNRHFKHNYDYVVVTGDIVGNSLKPIGDEDKKLEALRLYMAKEENKTKKAQFIYVKNEITLSPGLNEEKNIEIFRIHGNTAYKKFMDSVFSIEGDTVEYYANYVEKNGLPSGIYKLAPGEIENRSLSYKFIYKENRLIRVEQINSKGYPYSKSGPIDDPVIQEITYPDDKTIKIFIKTGTGKTEYVKEYKPYHGGFNRVNYLSPDESIGYYLNKDTLDYWTPTSSNGDFSKAQIRGCLLERNNDGYIIKKKYVRFQNSQEFQCDENGIYGIEYIRDERGLPVYEFYLGENDERVEMLCGTAGIRLIFNESGSIIEQDFICSDLSNSNQNGICKIKYKRDENGNVVEQTTFDKDDKETTALGIHKEVYIYEDGLNIEVRYQDKYGKNVNSPLGVSIMRRVFNEQGYEIRNSFFDKEEKPTFGKFDEIICSICQISRDNKGNIIEVRYFDINEKPCKGYSGTEVIKHNYDISGNIIEDIFCDSFGKLQEDENGIAKCQFLYDEYGRKSEESYYGSDEKLHKNKFGFAVIKIDHDEETGNISAMSYYDENKKAVEVLDIGCFKMEVYYNERGLEKETWLYNSEGKPKEGICRETYNYDKHGILSEWENYNKNNELENDSFGHARTIHCLKDAKEYYDFFDKNNNIIEKRELSYDKKGNPVKIWIRKGNNLEEEECQNRIYDERGNLIEILFTNEKGTALVNNSVGIAKYQYRYDERDNQLSESYYDCENKLYNFNKRFAKIVNKFDLRGNIIERYKYTKDGALFKEEDGSYGYKYSYDSLSRPIKGILLGKNRRHIENAPYGFSEIQIKYLSENDCVIQYFDDCNHFITDMQGHYSIKEQKNERIGQCSSEKQKFERTFEYRLANFTFHIITREYLTFHCIIRE